MQQITIVEATPADAPEAIRLFGELHRFNAGLDPRFELAEDWEQLVQQYLQQSHRSHDSSWFLAWQDARAIGFVLVEVHTDSPLYRHRRWAEIVGLYVEPAYRGKQVAHLLMEHAYAWALQHNLRIMQLYVTATNVHAQQFYAKEGFVISQAILRRTLTGEQALHEVPAEHPHQRLHFSEGGARPLDMHEYIHTESAADRSQHSH